MPPGSVGWHGCSTPSCELPGFTALDGGPSDPGVAALSIALNDKMRVLAPLLLPPVVP